MKKVLCFVMNIILILTPCLAFADGFAMILMPSKLPCSLF